MPAGCHGAPWLLGAVAIVLGSGIESVARADEPPPPASSSGEQAPLVFHGTERRARVYLKGGSVLEGRIQIEPAVGVHIQREDGGVVFVRRQDTMRIEEFDEAPRPASGETALPPADAAPYQSAKPITVSLDGPRGATLEVETALPSAPSCRCA
jgi:hypothetical protein